MVHSRLAFSRLEVINEEMILIVSVTKIGTAKSRVRCHRSDLTVVVAEVVLVLIK